jgi:hypothetical protein
VTKIKSHNLRTSQNICIEQDRNKMLLVGSKKAVFLDIFTAVTMMDDVLWDMDSILHNSA